MRCRALLGTARKIGQRKGDALQCYAWRRYAIQGKIDGIALQCNAMLSTARKITWQRVAL